MICCCSWSVGVYFCFVSFTSMCLSFSFAGLPCPSFLFIYLFIRTNGSTNVRVSVSVCVVYSIVIVCLPLAPSNHFDGHVTHLLCSTEIYVDIFLHVFGTFFRLLSIPSYYFYDCIIRDFNLLFLFFVFVDVIVGADDNR